jgi:hypothetical protein
MADENVPKSRTNRRNQILEKRFVTKEDFMGLFKYDENDRDPRELNKEFKLLEKKFKNKFQFKHLIDFYLGSSD